MSAAGAGEVAPEALDAHLGYVDASDAEGAKAAAATQFNLDEVRRYRIIVQELG